MLSISAKKQPKSKMKIVLGIGIFLVVISVVLFVTLSGKDNMNSVIASVKDKAYREAINKDYSILANGSVEEKIMLIFPSYGLCLNEESVNNILAEYGAEVETVERENDPSSSVFNAILDRVVVTPKYVEKSSTGYMVTYEIETPNLSDFKEHSSQTSTFTNLSDFATYMFTYIADAEVIKYEATVEYTDTNGTILGNYQSPEFVNAITGGLLEVYRDGYQELLESMMEVDK